MLITFLMITRSSSPPQKGDARCCNHISTSNTFAGLDMYYKGQPGSLSGALGKSHQLGMPLGQLGGLRSLVPPPMPPLPGSGPPPPPAELIVDTPDVMQKVRVCFLIC